MANNFDEVFVRFLNRRVLAASSVRSIGLSLGGVGFTTLKVIGTVVGVCTSVRVDSLRSEDLRLLEDVFDKRCSGRTIRRFSSMRIEEKRRSGMYAGLRHSQRLPVRGQRSHSNARTARRVL